MPAFFAHQFLEPLQQFRANACGIVREINQVGLAILKDLEGELITSMMRDQRAVQGLDAALVAFVVPG